MKNLMILILSGMLLLLSACTPSTGKKEVEVDSDALADKLLESEFFGETLNPVDDGIVETIYNIEHASSTRLYVGSGAVADELAPRRFPASGMISSTRVFGHWMFLEAL